jgi:hopanoid biosynthesis associated protein HpnK
MTVMPQSRFRRAGIGRALQDRRLVVVADDFGISSTVNRAVAEACEKGIVTSASIMAGGEAFEEAADIARKMKALSVGLHLTLCDGKAALPASSASDLADAAGCFDGSPARAWIRYSNPGLLEQLDREIEAQFGRLVRSGINPTHIDGHHHLHMHPVIFALVCKHALKRGVRWVRVPVEPLCFALRPGGRGLMPLLEWTVFRPLSFFLKRRAELHGLLVPDQVYGLSLTGRLDEHSLLDLLGRWNAGVTEIFAHPDFGTKAGLSELKALTSQAAFSRISEEGIELAGYRELGSNRQVPGNRN